MITNKELEKKQQRNAAVLIDALGMDVDCHEIIDMELMQ